MSRDSQNLGRTGAIRSDQSEAIEQLQERVKTLVSDFYAPGEVLEGFRTRIDEIAGSRKALQGLKSLEFLLERKKSLKDDQINLEKERREVFAAMSGAVYDPKAIDQMAVAERKRKDVADKWKWNPKGEHSSLSESPKVLRKIENPGVHLRAPSFSYAMNLQREKFVVGEEIKKCDLLLQDVFDQKDISLQEIKEIIEAPVSTSHIPGNLSVRFNNFFDRMMGKNPGVHESTKFIENREKLNRIARVRLEELSRLEHIDPELLEMILRSQNSHFLSILSEQGLRDLVNECRQVMEDSRKKLSDEENAKISGVFKESASEYQSGVMDKINSIILKRAITSVLVFFTPFGFIVPFLDYFDIISDLIGPLFDGPFSAAVAEAPKHLPIGLGKLYEVLHLDYLVEGFLDKVPLISDIGDIETMLFNNEIGRMLFSTVQVMKPVLLFVIAGGYLIKHLDEEVEHYKTKNKITDSSVDKLRDILAQFGQANDERKKEMAVKIAEMQFEAIEEAFGKLKLVEFILDGDKKTIAKDLFSGDIVNTIIAIKDSLGEDADKDEVIKRAVAHLEGLDENITENRERQQALFKTMQKKFSAYLGYESIGGVGSVVDVLNESNPQYSRLLADGKKVLRREFAAYAAETAGVKTFDQEVEVFDHRTGENVNKKRILVDSAYAEDAINRAKSILAESLLMAYRAGDSRVETKLDNTPVDNIPSTSPSCAGEVSSPIAGHAAAPTIAV